MQQRMPMSDTMRRNVDVILNKDYALNTTYSDSGILLTKRPESTLLHIECTFHGHNADTGEDYEFEPYQINQIVMKQLFNETYTDEISLVLTLTPVQLLNMLDNYRSLKCHVKMFPVIQSNQYIDYETSIYDQDFIAVFKDKEIRKRISKQALIPDTEYEKTNEQHDQLFDRIELQLISESAYLIRKQKFNFMLRDATVKDVIFYLAQNINAKNVSIVEPDNTTKFTNFVIPPQQTFATAMEFLQEYYGIYNKGLAYYFTGDTLFVYPAYETKPTTPESAHFYYAGEDACTGSDIYHAYSDDIIHVVVSSTPVVTDLVDGGVENFGNAILFQHADRIIDLQSSIGEGKDSKTARTGLGLLDIRVPNTDIFSMKTDDFGMSQDAYNIEYRFDYANQLRYKSDMYSYMRSLIGFKWQNAIPNVFKPGFLAHYHYDGEDTTRRPSSETGDDANISYSDSAEYMTRDGIVQQAIWSFKPVQGVRNTSDYIYSCIGEIVMSVEYEPAKPDQESSVSTDKVTAGKSAYKGYMDQNGTTPSSGSTTKTTAAATSFFSL